MTRRPLAPTATRRWVLAAILGGAAVLRLTTVLWLADTVPYTDYAYYDMAGAKVADDPGFFFDASQVEYYGKFGWWPPLYPFFVGGLYALFGANHRLVVFAQVVLGVLVCWLVFRLGRRLGGESTGLVAAALVAVDPTYVFATNLLASENLFVLWLALGLLLVTRSELNRGTLAGAGVLFGVAALTRATGLVLPAITVPWLRPRLPSRIAWLRASAWLLGACAITIAPWTLRNAIVVGSPALVCFGGGLNFYFGHNDAGIGYRDLSTTPMAELRTQADIDREGYRRGLAHIGADPLGVVIRSGKKVVDLFGVPRYAPHDNTAILLPDGWRSDPAAARAAEALRARQRAKNRLLDGPFTWLAMAHSVVILAGALFAVGRWRRLGSAARLLVYLCLGWIGAHVVFWAQPRFRYPMEIFLILLAALAMTQRRASRPTAAVGRVRA